MGKKNKTIFAAQSKKVFYCKDAICEFIFKELCIPINPFQVFGYFLNDRVDRNLVRNGNNELISRCDELWVFGPIADGVLFEISIAFQLKIPVRFFTVGSLQFEIREITDITKLVFEPEVKYFVKIVYVFDRVHPIFLGAKHVAQYILVTVKFIVA